MLYTIFELCYLTLYISYQEKEKISNEFLFSILRAKGVKPLFEQNANNPKSKTFYLLLHRKFFHTAGIFAQKIEVNHPIL